MIILGIETSGNICGTGLAKDEKMLSEVFLTVQNTHSEHLYTCIHKSLADASVNIKDLSGVAVSAGPGSFTGLRIGVSAAKGITYSLDIPLFLIPTLDIAAQYGGGPIICSIIPSIRGEYFFSLYKDDGETVVRISEYTLGRIEDIPENENILFSGFINDELKEKLHKRFTDARFVEKYSPSMGFIAAKLGCRMFAEGKGVPLDSSEPLYMRDFDIKKKQL